MVEKVSTETKDREQKWLRQFRSERNNDWSLIWLACKQVRKNNEGRKNNHVPGKFSFTVLSKIASRRFNTSYQAYKSTFWKYVRMN
jgi:hypothetical protein